jgi:putative ATP-dependent endonuclease of the OLD family
MKLKELQIKGYKCFKDKTIIPIQDLSILIGENDSGKSSILRALELLLLSKMPNDEDYFSLDIDSCDEFTIGARFSITDSDNAETLKHFIVEDELIFKKVFRKQEAFKTYIKKSVFENANLERYLGLDAPTTKLLLSELGIDDLPRQIERQDAISEYINTNLDILPRKVEEIEIKFNTISSFLPMFQYYSSHDYGNPQSLIKKTLDDIYSSHFYDEEGTLKIDSLKGLKETVLNELNSNIQEKLLEKIQLYNPKVAQIQGRLDIDFSRGLDFQGLELDEGNGFKLIDQKGEGSKKKMFLSILEWDKEVQRDLTNSRAVIRVYDEPDTSLHYEAQRKLFNAIYEVASNPDSNTQAVIATHSVVMVDKAPAKSIVQVIQNNGCSSIDYLKSETDEDISDFLNQISTVGGIKNSSIFFEKCFLIVEGDSEKAAVPMIYEKLFSKKLPENGIVLINLQSNGAWSNFLRLLKDNKKHSTVMLLDTDTQNAECGANVTIEKLNALGFEEDFLVNNVFFAGTQEFEDIFPDNKINEVFNVLYPKSENEEWVVAEIESLRNDYPKISKGFWEESKKYISHHKKRYKKPEFTIELVKGMTKVELEEIEVLIKLFAKVHEIVS